LSRVETGDRWKNSKGITAEENNVVGVTSYLGLVLWIQIENNW
jgi:hypothetical protein